MSVAFNEANRISAEKKDQGTGAAPVRLRYKLRGLHTEAMGVQLVKQDILHYTRMQMLKLMNEVESVNAAADRYLKFMDNPAGDKQLGGTGAALNVYKSSMVRSKQQFNKSIKQHSAD